MTFISRSITYYATFTYGPADEEDENSQNTYRFIEWLAEEQLNELTDENVFATLTSGTDGYIHIEDLPAGTYTLTETKAPDGYNLLSEPIAFTVGSSGVTIVGSYSGVTVGGTDGIELQVENVSSAALPNTGGHGTLWYTIGGLALILGAALCLMYRYTRRRKEVVS